MGAEANALAPAGQAAQAKRHVLGRWWTYIIVLLVGVLIGGMVVIRGMQNQAVKHGGAMWKKDSKSGSMVFLWHDQFEQASSFDDPKNRPPIDNCAPTVEETDAAKQAP